MSVGAKYLTERNSGVWMACIDTDRTSEYQFNKGIYIQRKKLHQVRRMNFHTRFKS